jgi:hypothetical protein
MRIAVSHLIGCSKNIMCADSDQLYGLLTKLYFAPAPSKWIAASPKMDSSLSVLLRPMIGTMGSNR